MIFLALTFFLVANPIGNAPAIIALVKGFGFQRQRLILLRESGFALILALFFQYFGERFLSILNIQQYAVTIAGGFLLLFVAFNMMGAIASQEKTITPQQEPFFVPIATPILSGPGLLAIIMVKSRTAGSALEVTFAILLAWVGVVTVLGIAPYLYKILGRSGFTALEQIMGMLLALVSMEMIVKGVSLLLKA